MGGIDMKKSKSEIYLLVMGLAMAGGIFYGKETVGAKSFSKNVQVAIGNSEKLSVGNKSNSIKWTVVSGKNNIKIVDKKANQLSISGKKTGTAIINAKVSGKNTTFKYKIKVKKVVYSLKKGTLTIKGKGKAFSKESGLFWENTAIKKVVVKKGITELPPSAFRSCTNIESVNIASSVKKIGDRAFGGCKKIKEVVCPGEFNVYGNGYADNGSNSDNSWSKDTPFPEECGTVRFNSQLNTKKVNTDIISAKKIYVWSKDKKYKNIDGNIYSKDGKTFVMYAGKNTVLKFADSCKNVDFSFKVPKSIVIGKGIEKITTNSDVPFDVSEEGTAYSGNLKWSDITFENGIVLEYDSVKALLTEGYFGRKLYKTFDKEMKYQNGMYIWGEKYLTDYDGEEVSLEIPDGITEINAGAFAQCTRMPEKITIPDSVLKIEKYTFNNQNTGRLKEIVMSDKTIADKDAIEQGINVTKKHLEMELRC